MNKFRKGDLVSVEGTVTAVGNATMEISIPDGCGDSEKICVTTRVAKLVEPVGPPEPGDTVIHKDNEAKTYTVLAVDDDAAWVRAGDGRMTVLVANLIVVDRA
jgi:hypothetical protein